METGYSHRSSQYSNVHSTATVLCCTYPRHPIYPVWAARPRTRPLIGMLSLLSVTGVFQFPRPGQSPQSPFHHNITSKDWHRPRHRCSCWQLPFYLIKKTFHKFPWKLENSNCLVTDKRRGRKGSACQKLVLKLASAQSPVTTAHLPGTHSRHLQVLTLISHPHWAITSQSSTTLSPLDHTHPSTFLHFWNQCKWLSNHF